MKTGVLVLAFCLIWFGFASVSAQDSDLHAPLAPTNAAQLKPFFFQATSLLQGIDWSPDGRTLAAFESEGVALYDMTQPGAAPRVIARFVFTDSAIAFSPDGARLAVGAISHNRAGDHQVILLDTQGNTLWEMPGHQGSVIAVAFSPDGARLASAGVDGTVRLWDAITGQSLAVLQGHTNRVYDVAFSPDGSLLVSSGQDATVRLWDAITGEAIVSLTNVNWVQTFAFSADGAWLAFPTGQGTIMLWDVAARREQAVLLGAESLIVKIAFSPDARLLVSASLSSAVQVWDTTTFTQVAELETERVFPNDLAFNPDGTLLALANSEGFELWGVPPGSPAAVTEPVTRVTTGPLIQADTASQVEQLHWFSVSAPAGMVWSPDGQTLTISQLSSQLKFYNTTTQSTEESYLGRGSDRFEVTSLALSPDGLTLALGDRDGRVTLLNVQAHVGSETAQRHPVAVTALAFSPDGSRLASADQDGFINLWDGVNGGLISIDMEHKKAVNQLVFSPDGPYLFSASEDGTVCRWDLATYTPQNVITVGAPIRSLVLSGSRMAFGDPEGVIHLWDVDTWTEQAVLTGHSDAITTLAVSPDGSLLASGSADTRIRLWEMRTGTSLVTLQKHTGIVLQLAFSPDSTTLASGGRDDAVRLWGIPASPGARPMGAAANQLITAASAHAIEPQIKLDFFYRVIHWAAGSQALVGVGLTEGAQRIQLPDQAIQSWQIQRYALWTVLPSPDGMTVAASVENDVLLWDAASDTNRFTLQGHSQPANALAFSPDGSLLAGGSDDTTIRLWNVITGENRLTLTGHTQAVQDVVFSPDGTRLASIAANDAVRLWDVTTGQVLAVLKSDMPAGMAVAFTPDGTALLSLSSANRIQIWDLNTNSLKTELRGVPIRADCLDVSPNGELIATSGDGKLQLWDMATGTLLAELETGFIAIDDVEFSPDGLRLLVRDMNHVVEVWGVPADADLTAGSTRVPGTCTVLLPESTPNFSAPNFTARMMYPAHGQVSFNGTMLDQDGLIWYRMDNGNWMPEDLLKISALPAECADLPLVTP